MSPEYWRLTPALLLSLLMHALLLTLTFGGQGLWPGFGLPWQARRIEAPDLRVVVVPAQVTAAESLPPASVEETIASGPIPTPSISSAPAQRLPTSAITVRAKPKAEAKPTTDAATVSAPAEMPLRADRPGDTAPPPIPAPAVIAATPTDETGRGQSAYHQRPPLRRRQAVRARKSECRRFEMLAMQRRRESTKRRASARLNWRSSMLSTKRSNGRRRSARLHGKKRPVRKPRRT